MTSKSSDVLHDYLHVLDGGKSRVIPVSETFWQDLAGSLIGHIKTDYMHDRNISKLERWVPMLTKRKLSGRRVYSCENSVNVEIFVNSEGYRLRFSSKMLRSNFGRLRLLRL